MITPSKGDAVVTHNGGRGIVTSDVFRTSSGFDRDAVRVAFEVSFGVLEMPIELTWIAEVWRDGQRIDNSETVQQLELFRSDL